MQLHAIVPAEAGALAGCGPAQCSDDAFMSYREVAQPARLRRECLERSQSRGQLSDEIGSEIELPRGELGARFGGVELARLPAAEVRRDEARKPPCAVVSRARSETLPAPEQGRPFLLAVEDRGGWPSPALR